MNELIIKIAVQPQQFQQVLSEIAFRKFNYAVHVLAKQLSMAETEAEVEAWPVEPNRELIKPEFEPLDAAMEFMHPSAKFLVEQQILEYGKPAIEQSRIIFEYEKSNKANTKTKKELH